MEVFYKQALTMRNEFLFLVDETFTMNNEKFKIKDIVIVPAETDKQKEFFKDHNILPYITGNCDLAVIFNNDHYKAHYPYLTLESLLKLMNIDFKVEDYAGLKYSLL
jgi:hypothetical protein